MEAMTTTQSNPFVGPATQLATQLSAVRKHLCTMFPEREAAVDAILTAAVAGEHVLIVGIPGTGKSALAREFSRCIDGSYYEYLFNRFTTPDEFLGPFSIKGLNQDKYERVLTGRLADCQVAFLDELFKSNSASLNTMLPILNERIVFQGGGAQDIPLRLAVCASNELPSDPTLRALWDRIQLRVFVHPLRDEKNREAVMLKQTLGNGQRPMVSTKLLDVVNVDKDVTLTPGAIKAMMKLRRTLESAGIVYGDRRWVKAATVVRAYALVGGSITADGLSLGILTAVLWDKEAQMADVANVVHKMSAPSVQKARMVYDAISKTAGEEPEKQTVEQISLLMPKMKLANQKLIKLVNEAKPGRERQEVSRIKACLRADFGKLRDVLRERYGLDEMEDDS